MEQYRSGHNGADSKSVCRQRHVGSNPTVSARTPQLFVLRELWLVFCTMTYVCAGQLKEGVMVLASGFHLFNASGLALSKRQIVHEHLNRRR